FDTDRCLVSDFAVGSECEPIGSRVGEIGRNGEHARRGNRLQFGEVDALDADRIKVRAPAGGQWICWTSRGARRNVDEQLSSAQSIRAEGLCPQKRGGAAPETAGGGADDGPLISRRPSDSKARRDLIVDVRNLAVQ